MKISNNMLIVLVILALLSIITSMLIILDRLGAPSMLSGLATADIGVVNVTISATTDINLIVDNVDFGTSTLLTGGQNTSINTSDTIWGGNANPGTFNEPGPFMIRNDGNAEVNLTVNSSATAQSFIGGTNPGYYFVGSYAGARDGCSGDIDGDNFTIANNDTINPFSTTPVPICDNLTFPDNGDQMNISIFIDIPPDVAAGLKTDSTFEVDATALCGC